ncbi:MAG: thermonuclease family protein [Candidatus Orphnella occulta]|nr:thermonuclease family protein [Candidatus Orphnella occulta]
MKLLICIILLLVCGCASNKIYVDSSEVEGLGAVVSFPAGKIVPINVKDVISGSLIKLTNNELASYIGIYIPDVYAIPASARKLNEDLVVGSDVRLEFDLKERDSKGRLLVYVFTREARLINAEIVRAGLAKVLISPPNNKYRQELLHAEKQARESGRGLWSEDFDNK